MQQRINKVGLLTVQCKLSSRLNYQNVRTVNIVSAPLRSSHFDSNPCARHNLKSSNISLCTMCSPIPRLKSHAVPHIHLQRRRALSSGFHEILFLVSVAWLNTLPSVFFFSLVDTVHSVSSQLLSRFLLSSSLDIHYRHLGEGEDKDRKMCAQESARRGPQSKVMKT